MVRWRIEEKMPTASKSIWSEIGTYDSEEGVLSALNSLQLELDRCSITRWSSQDGVSEMEIMPARRWLKGHGG